MERYTAWMTLDSDAMPSEGAEIVDELFIDVTETVNCDDLYPEDGMDESCEH